MYTFGFPTRIQFGAGSRKAIPEFLLSRQLTRPLIVTDKGVATLPICRDMEALLKASGLEVATFSGVWGNPVKSMVDGGAEVYRKHKADSIIGFGGGAALDVAKAVALLASHSGDLWDYEGGNPKAKAIEGNVPPWIAVPTTSGTGSEVGRSAVISDEKTHIKKFVFSPKFLAATIFADPELTLDLPAAMTAATGMDALTHCVEAYLAKDFHPICDGIALEGVRLASQSLVKAVKNPHDIEARGLMMMVSLMGGIAFQKDLGLTHSCAHALGTAVDMHHGLANGIMIDFALKFNVPVRADRFRNLAMTVGLKDQTPEAFLNWLTDLKKEIGIPKNLAAAGVKKEKLDELVTLATDDSCHQYNPRPVTAQDFRAIFNEAF
jgi:alcohol dehydrogenase class IV